MRTSPRAFAALLSVAVLASACGDSTDDTAQPASTTNRATTTTAATPQTGGSIRVGQFSPLSGFDPVNSLGGSGTVGGIEMIAIYDTILARDTNTGAYVPRTAESMTPSSDFATWTLKLKPGIKFSDGTSYDAAAVKLNVERHTAPTSRSASRAPLSAFVKTIDVTDPLTLKFTLNQPWAGFPVLFTRDVGMIASPTAIAAAGAQFHATVSKAGAGPFVVESYNAGDSLVLARNDSYYGAKPYLDKITFVPMPAADRAYDGLTAASLQAAFMRTPDIVAKARENKDLAAQRTYSTAGAATRSGFTSAKVDATIDTMRTAATDTARTAAYKSFSEAFTAEVPSLPLLELENALVSTGKLHGVVRSDNSTFLFDKAWIER